MLTDKGINSAKTWPKPVPQNIGSGTLVTKMLWRGGKKRNVGLQSRNPGYQH